MTGAPSRNSEIRSASSVAEEKPKARKTRKPKVAKTEEPIAEEAEAPAADEEKAE